MREEKSIHSVGYLLYGAEGVVGALQPEVVGLINPLKFPTRSCLLRFVSVGFSCGNIEGS